MKKHKPKKILSKTHLNKVLINDPFTGKIYSAYLTPTGQIIRLFVNKTEAEKLRELRLLKKSLAKLREV